MKPYAFKATGTADVFMQVLASYVYYEESAVLSGGATDNAILVEDASGQVSLTLQPGQGFDLEGTRVNSWRVRNLGAVGSIEGRLLMGVGRVIDNRPAGETTIAGQAHVIVDSAPQVEAIPLNGVTFASNVIQPSNSPQAILLPAANLNGAIVELASLNTMGGTGNLLYASFLAKSSAPTHALDGDIILLGQQTYISSGHASVTGQLNRRVSVPAGKGIYYCMTSPGTEQWCTRSIHYRLL